MVEGSTTDGPRIGLLGAGLIATFHSKVRRHAGVPFVRSGVFDPDQARAVSFAAASVCDVVDGEDELIARSDAVYRSAADGGVPTEVA